MRKPVPLSTILLFLAAQSTLLIDVLHTPSSHEPAMNSYDPKIARRSADTCNTR